MIAPEEPNHSGCEHAPLTDDIRRLVTEYRKQHKRWNHYQRALMETKIWEAALPDHRQRFDRRDWVAHLTGAKAARIDRRSRLFHPGPITDPLWERVNRNLMPVGTAVRLLKDALQIAARRHAKSETAVSHALAEVLKQYDNQPGMSVMADGTVTRRRTPYSIRVRHEPRSRRPVEEETERTLWADLRETMHRMIGLKLVGVATEDIEVQRLVQGMERDVKVLFDDFQQRFYRVQKNAKRAGETVAMLSRASVVKACRTLAMDPPPTGKPVDLKAANKQKRRLAAQYHPDTHGGDQTTRSLYEAVLAAYYEIEQYNSQIAK